MNKKKVIIVGVISILVVLNAVFYLEGQRLQKKKSDLEIQNKLRVQEVKDLQFEYGLQKQQKEELQTQLDSKPQ